MRPGTREVMTIAAIGLTALAVTACGAQPSTVPTPAAVASAIAAVATSATASATPGATAFATATSTSTPTASTSPSATATPVVTATAAPTQPSVTASPAPATPVRTPAPPQATPPTLTTTPPGAGSGASVEIVNFAFVGDATISAGGTVTWLNNDGLEHNVTAKDGSFMSQSMTSQLGKTYTHRFDVAGSFDYYCSIHPFMTGTVTVR